MEFENMCTDLFQKEKKKNYAYMLWDPNNPSAISYIKEMGLAQVKRDWCPFTRRCLSTVTKYLLEKKLDLIAPFLETELNQLCSMKVPIKDLIVSKKFKGRGAYKQTTSLHFTVARNMSERTGMWPADNDRIPYLVMTQATGIDTDACRGTRDMPKKATKQQKYMRAEHPYYLKFYKGKWEIDWMHYLEKQFYTPMLKQLCFHFEQVPFESIYKKYHKTLEMKLAGSVNIFSLFS
jgi:DNA polymerase elongation subunit (family B)